MSNNPNPESITESTYRAVAGDADGQAEYSGVQPSLVVGRRRIVERDKKYTARLPHINDAKPINTQADIRGAADSAALYRRHHDDSIATRPNDPDTAELMDVLEQVRCEALGARQMDGVAKNLKAALEAACKKRAYHKAEDLGQPIAQADGLYALAFEKLTNQKLGKAANGAANGWRDHVDKQIGDKGFKGLSDVLDNQIAFQSLAQKFVQDFLGHALPKNTSEDQNSDETQDNAAAQEADEEADSNADSDDNSENQPDQNDTSKDSEDTTDSGDDMGDQLQDESSENVAGDSPSKQYGDSNGSTPIEQKRQYPIFTTEFDETVHAHSLSDEKELKELREKLDGQLAPLQTLINKLANRLQRILLARKQRHWQFDVDEGTLNTARLARIIADPNLPATYKQEIETDFQDTVITLLIDNSGSMRGRPITVAALTTDILAKTLERCGIKVEILGFTTVSWKGGKSRMKWTEGGRSAKPGRLNDIRHIIYKAADTPLRRSRDTIALMLKEGILKENIDGEALLWAYQRLRNRPEQRKIMMVVSDGAPVDDSTLSANSSSFLEQDLRQVISIINHRKDVELTAIGIGHDVGKYYENAVTIRDVNDLPPIMTNEMARLFQKS
jgi:cobaltochelatase CobT